MADPIREALERLLAVIKPKYTDPDEIVAVVRAMAAARTALAAEPPAPAPADHVPDAGNMVTADEEWEELAQWLERIGDDYDDLYRSPSALIRPKLARAAALLREARPQPVPGWQPIDTAPHDGTEILASDYDFVEILSWSWDAWETGSGWIDRDGRRLHPAWWQPLPEHPPTPTQPTTTEISNG